MSIPRNNQFHRPLLLAFGMLLLLVGSYVLYVVLSPELRLVGVKPTDNSTTRMLEQEEYTESMLYIPKIDVSVPYGTSENDLADGAWWRKNSNGNPQDGGNFVLAAHRFEMGITPAQTTQQSPFYHLGRLEIGDDIVVDYEGERYTYTVSRTYAVAPTDIEIEDRTDTPQLTLYTCTLSGSSDGRDVVIAVPKTS